MKLGQKEFTEKEFFIKLANFCAYQERSIFEVQEKLKGLGATPAVVKSVIAELKTLNYLDEERFARSFAHGKHRFKNWGKLRITNELQFKHHIAYPLIKSALEALDENNEYSDSLFRLAQTKYDKLEGAQQRFEKSVAYLQAKGYELNEILRVMNKIHTASVKD